MNDTNAAPAPVVAMVANSSVDLGIATGQRLLDLVMMAGGVALVFVAHEPRGGWAVSAVMFSATLLARGYLWLRRRAHLVVASKLLDRFGRARFIAGKGVVDEANVILSQMEE